MKVRFVSFSDRTVAQTVNRRLFTLEGRVQSQVTICQIYDGKVGIEAGLYQRFRFICRGVSNSSSLFLSVTAVL